MRAQRSQLERALLGAEEIAPEADLNHMMIRRRRSSASADRVAALEIVHRAADHAEASLSDGLFFKKGFATAEGFRPSYWVYERNTDDQAPAKDPIPLQPAHKAQRTSADAVIPLASVSNLAPSDVECDPEDDAGANAASLFEAASDEAEPAITAVANAQDIEPEADLSKVVIRRTPFIRSADCDPTIGLATEGAAKAALFGFATSGGTFQPSDQVGGHVPADHDDNAAVGESEIGVPAAAAPAPPAAAIEACLEAAEPATGAVEPPRQHQLVTEASDFETAPPVDAKGGQPKADPVARVSIVTELTEMIESVLSSKSYGTQQDAGTLRTSRERSGTRQRSGNAAQASTRHLAAAASSAVSGGGRAISSKRGTARRILAGLWRIGRVSVLAIVVTLLAEYLLTSWFSSGQTLGTVWSPSVAIPLPSASDARDVAHRRE